MQGSPTTGEPFVLTAARITSSTGARSLNTYLSTLTYLSLWLLFGALVALLGRALSGTRTAGPVRLEALPAGMENAVQALLAGLAGTIMVLSLLLLCWVVAPHGGATDVLGAGVLLLVLLVALLHICRRGLLPGQGRR